MHNQQQHLKTNNIIPKLAVIVLSIVLLTGISLVPALQIGVDGQVQQQQPQQQNQVGLTQVIKQIAQQVVAANPGTTANHVQQILVQLAKQIAQTLDQSTAIQVIKQIESQVSSFPKGRVSQAVIQIAKQQAAGNTTLITQVMQQAAQQIRTGVPGANALVQVALQAASGGTPGINQQLNQIAQQVANGTGGQQTQILQTLQQIALQISNTEEGGGRDKVQQTIKVIHDDVSKNKKGRVSKSFERVTNYYYFECNCEFYFDPVYIHKGDITNNFVEFGVQVAVGSPGAVQQLDQITEQVSLETGGDPAQVKGVVQNLALTNSIEGGNTQELINNIATEVTEPNDPVSKSLTSLAVQEEQGNYEVVNIAVEKVAEGAVGGNDVEQLVTTAAATTTEGTTGAAPLGEAAGEFGATAVGGTTGGEGAPGAAAIGGDGAAAIGGDGGAAIGGDGGAAAALDEEESADEEEAGASDDSEEDDGGGGGDGDDGDGGGDGGDGDGDEG